MPLRLERYANGIYRIRGSHHGRRVDASARTRIRADAEKVLEATERKIFDEAVLGKAPERSFAEAAAGYMRGGGEREHLAPILTRIGNLPLKEVTQDVIDRLALELYPREAAADATRLRKVYTPISAVMVWGADAWGLDRRRIRRPKSPPGRVDWRTPQEIETLLEHAGHLAPILTAYVGTGARATEMLELDWRDVSPAAARLTFWETKGGYPRHVDLCQRVRAALPQRGLGPVWKNSRGEPWHCYDAINLQLRKLCSRHGLPHIHLHVLRHTWATWTYAVTKDLTKLMAQGGWKSADLAMRYVHAGTDDLARDVLEHGWGESGTGLPHISRPFPHRSATTGQDLQSLKGAKG